MIVMVLLGALSVLALAFAALLLRTAAALGVAYRAKPVVGAQADAKVDHADLTALLYFQGYSVDELKR